MPHRGLPRRDHALDVATGGSAYQHAVPVGTVAVSVDPSNRSSVAARADHPPPRRGGSACSATWWCLARRGPAIPVRLTSVDAASGVLLARNAYNQEFAQRVAFATAHCRLDRRPAIGRNSSVAYGGASGGAGAELLQGGAGPASTVRRAADRRRDSSGRDAAPGVRSGPGANRRRHGAGAAVRRDRRGRRCRSAKQYRDETLDAVQVHTQTTRST